MYEKRTYIPISEEKEKPSRNYEMVKLRRVFYEKT